MVVVRMNFFGINKSVDIFTFLGKKILSVSHGKHYPALLEYDTCYLVKLYTIKKWGEQNPRWIIATILQNWHFYCVLNVQGFSPWQWYQLMHIYTWGKLRPALQFVIMIYRAIPIEETFAIWRFVGVRLHF